MSRFSEVDPWAPPRPISHAEIASMIRRRVAWRPIPVLGMIAELPTEGNGWTQEEYDAWMKAFRVILEYSVPILPPPTPQDETTDV